ncbi:MAG TPA: CDP-diacylglycerol--serine O-phosphatidyltransferase [Calditerricola sp.]
MVAKTLPNLFTVANLFLGIISIVLAFQGQPEHAAVLVIVGMLLDGLDGRVARKLGVQSEFGKELDSLSDVISFGVAPAFIMYVVVLQDLGLYGLMVTALFPICGALRLARFNISEGNAHYFVGLPITAAGGVLATFALYHHVFSPVYLTIGMLALSLLMISNVKYPNFKRVGIPRAAIWVTPILVGIVGYLAWRFPDSFSKLIFLPLVLYALYGLKKNLDALLRRNQAVQDPIETDVHS